MQIGKIYANNVEDRESIESIKRGYINGEGILGQVIESVQDLISTYTDIAYCDEDNCSPLIVKREVYWIMLYRALKEIENAT